MVLKREPGENPGLPRSGKWERKPSIKHWPMVGWEATVSRNALIAVCSKAHESEDLPIMLTTCQTFAGEDGGND
jgi:hypothetical protein